MKKQGLLILFILQSFWAVGQDQQKLSIFKNSKNWNTEIIQFPIDWAPDLKVRGFEELLFSPEWSNQESDQFWSLLIGWKVEATRRFSSQELQYNLKSYFDGLMKPNHWAQEFPEPKVSLKSENLDLTGYMTFFDGFHTGKVITVNIKIRQLFCRKQKQVIVVFRLSPKKFDHPIWNELQTFQIKEIDVSNKIEHKVCSLYSMLYNSFCVYPCY